MRITCIAFKKKAVWKRDFFHHPGHHPDPIRDTPGEVARDHARTPLFFTPKISVFSC